MLEQALRDWKSLGFEVEPRLIKVFDAGLSHYCGLLESAGQNFVIKAFTHSFERTISLEHLANNAGISPAILSTSNNIAVYQFIPNREFQISDLPHLCTSLKLTHGIKHTNTKAINLLEVCQSYLEYTPNELRQVHLQLRPLINEFSNDPAPLVFCHNDLVKENCLFDQQQAWLIDWEFAQLNNPWFDLASVILYFELDKHQANSFLSDYFSNQEFNVESRICLIAMLCVLWCDLLWQVKNSGLDYINNNKERFETLKNLSKKLGIELTGR